MAEVKAQLNNLRLAPRKVRAVTKMIKGKSADAALNQLEFMIRRPSLPVKKLIDSAIANAENNFNMVRSNLFVKEFRVDEGVKLKRYRPKAFGRMGEIQKKTSRIVLVLGEKVPGLKGEAKKKTDLPAGRQEKHEHPEQLSTHEHDHEERKDKKPEMKTEIGKKTESPKGFKKFFQRKVV